MPEPYHCHVHGWSTDPLCREYCCNTGPKALWPLCRGCGVRTYAGGIFRLVMGGELEGVYHEDCVPQEALNG